MRILPLLRTRHFVRRLAAVVTLCVALAPAAVFAATASGPAPKLATSVAVSVEDCHPAGMAPAHAGHHQDVAGAASQGGSIDSRADHFNGHAPSCMWDQTACKACAMSATLVLPELAKRTPPLDTSEFLPPLAVVAPDISSSLFKPPRV